MALTKHYSDFLTSWSSLVGIPMSRLSTEYTDVANTLFNSAIRQMWSQGPWLDVCPYGEARFAGNKLSYPNDLSQSDYWDSLNVTATGNEVANPLDGRITASSILEIVLNPNVACPHNLTNEITVLPATTYTLSAYLRGNGRNYAQLALNDGVTAFSAIFNLSTGVVSSIVNASTTSMAQQANGFYLCSITFTSTNVSVVTADYALSLVSDNGTSLSYVSNATKGIYAWGCLAQQVTNTTLNDSRVDWDQLGEYDIDAVFNVWSNSPMLVTYPTTNGYSLTPTGIQLISSTTSQSYTNGVVTVSTFPVTNNPVFLYYRKAVPDYSGNDYDLETVYDAGEQFYYTDANGDGDFYTCLIATTGGSGAYQNPVNPQDEPSWFEVIEIPVVFFPFCVYQTFADWLISDGQQDKAVGMYSIAQSKMDTEFDKRERQMGDVFPMKVSTHLTSRSGY